MSPGVVGGAVPVMSRSAGEGRAAAAAPSRSLSRCWESRKPGCGDRPEVYTSGYWLSVRDRLIITVIAVITLNHDRRARKLSLTTIIVLFSELDGQDNQLIILISLYRCSRSGGGPSGYN